MSRKTSFLYPYIIISLLWGTSFISLAQSPLDIKVTAVFQELTLAEIFKEVEQHQSFTFYYRSADLPDQQKFSITLEETSIREMLQELLKVYYSNPGSVQLVKRP